MLTADEIQYRLLKRFPAQGNYCNGSAYLGKSKLRILLGDDLLNRVPGKTVIDFGCGSGEESIELAKSGAARVIGVDIQENALARAREAAERAGLAGVCRFVSAVDEKADIIVSIDAFEHFSDPAAILEQMNSLLRPDGEVLINFGPTWYHPMGGHLFSVFPWAHLLFSEQALIRWRSDHRSDGATRFSEVEGGLNQMTIGRFERLVRLSPFQLAFLEAVPIRKFRLFHTRLTREFTTAVVRCRLTKRH